MGKEGLRYAAKVDLDKPAAEQNVLHVSFLNSCHVVETLTSCRTVGTLTVTGLHLALPILPLTYTSSICRHDQEQ